MAAWRRPLSSSRRCRLTGKSRSRNQICPQRAEASMSETMTKAQAKAGKKKNELLETIVVIIEALAIALVFRTVLDPDGLDAIDADDRRLLHRQQVGVGLRQVLLPDRATVQWPVPRTQRAQ